MMTPGAAAEATAEIKKNKY